MKYTIVRELSRGFVCLNIGFAIAGVIFDYPHLVLFNGACAAFGAWVLTR